MIVWRRAWREDYEYEDDEEPVEHWAPTGFCEEHYPEAKAEAVRGRIDELVGPYEQMRVWALGNFPAADAVGAAAKAEAERWLEHPYDRNLLIDGPVGSGKTSLAFSCARALIARNIHNEVRFRNVPLLLGQLLRSRFRDDPTEELIAADYLVLDDLGAERVIDSTRDVLARIVYGRHAAELPTIVTSNFRPSELAQRLGYDDPTIGLRIVSRLTQDAFRIRLDRPDLRARTLDVNGSTPTYLREEDA
jgi:DNA replication protein DnaC